MMVILGPLPGPPAPKSEVIVIVLIAVLITPCLVGVGVLLWWLLPPA